MNLTSEEQTGNESEIRKTARNECRNLLRDLKENRKDTLKEIDDVGGA